MPSLLPLSLEGKENLAGEMPPLQLIEELSPAEDHLAGGLAEFFSRVQGGPGLLYRSVGVSGVEGEKSAEGAVFSLELLPGLTLQEALEGEACGTGEAAREVQDGPLVFFLEEDQARMDTEVELWGSALRHS